MIPRAGRADESHAKAFDGTTTNAALSAASTRPAASDRPSVSTHPTASVRPTASIHPTVSSRPEP